MHLANDGLYLILNLLLALCRRLHVTGESGIERFIFEVQQNTASIRIYLFLSKRAGRSF